MTYWHIGHIYVIDIYMSLTYMYVCIYLIFSVYLTYFVYIFSILSGGGRTPSKAVDVNDEDPAPSLSPLLSRDSGKNVDL
jgi:hypothetical protein